MYLYRVSLINPFTPRSGQSQNSARFKFPNFQFGKGQKKKTYMSARERFVKVVSFKWSHHRMSSTDSKDRKMHFSFMMISHTTSPHKISTFNMFNTVADDTKLSRLDKGASYHSRLSSLVRSKSKF